MLNQREISTGSEIDDGTETHSNLAANRSIFARFWAVGLKPAPTASSYRTASTCV